MESGGEDSRLLRQERKVWVYQGEPTDASIPDLIDREREKRLRELSGV